VTVAADLRAILQTSRVLDAPAELQTYAYDASFLTQLAPRPPDAVVIAASTDDISVVMRYASTNGPGNIKLPRNTTLACRCERARSARQPAAVDRQHRTVYVVGGTGCEEYGGSALGVAGVDGLAALPSALVGTYAYCEDALVERFHDGVDVSVIVLETDDGLRSLEPTAIEYEKGHEFDFSARYTAEFVSLSRPDMSEEQLERLGEVSRQAHRTLGLRDVSRSDFIVAADGSFVVLETAITPGTTETSVFPFACTASGTSLGEVARDLLARAIAAGPPA